MLGQGTLPGTRRTFVGTLEELTPQACHDLVARHQVGRLALATPDGLRIYPVSYVLRDDAVVFRTTPYGEIAHHAPDAQVAFSVDDLDVDLRSGWHVLLVGTCRRIEDPEEVRAIREVSDPEPWAQAQRTMYFRLTYDEATGRRVVPD